MSTVIGNPGAAPGGATSVRLGKYVLDAPLGMGGMAEVFRGHTEGAEGFQRPVAIKRVLPDASRNPAFAEMFVSEAKLSSRMQHANIVSVLDFDRDHEGRLYLVMELVEGRDLDGIIDSGRLPFSIVIYTITEVLRGLGYAHDLPAGADGVRGLVHRDISPHNVLCSWSGAVKVSDFGIAKARAATAASASVTIKGKPAYMSPEQINGSPLDGRSDLFAVGIMMWQMLTGGYLFASGTTAETLARVLFSNVTPPNQVTGDIPPDLEAVTMKLLAKDPAQRYQSAEEAIDDLLRCQHAPRDGRRELEALLVQRFPQKAPVRTGQRSRMEGAGGLASGTPGQTVPNRWTPEQAAVMNAPTYTVQPATPGPTVPGYAAARVDAPAKPKTGLIVGGVVAAVALVVVIVLVASGGGSGAAPAGTPPVGAAGGVVDAAAAQAVDAGVVPVDASEAVLAPPDAAVLVDAAAPPPDARKRSGGHGGGSAGGGTGSSTIKEIPIPGQ
ncbi:MAG: serine/threonine protein kinase [Myxococcales bacterium]|nr:serine/threonine protein kinase [Myxococcales bacterium]